MLVRNNYTYYRNLICIDLRRWKGRENIVEQALKVFEIKVFPK